MRGLVTKKHKTLKTMFGETVQSNHLRHIRNFYCTYYMNDAGEMQLSTSRLVSSLTEF